MGVHYTVRVLGDAVSCVVDIASDMGDHIIHRFRARDS